jgi:DNA excision repair protein ERCC-3
MASPEEGRGTLPLIIQSDLSVLLDVHTPRAEEARAAIAPFAELVKSPEHLHTYRISPLSLWNAFSSGQTPESVVEALARYSRYELPPVLASSVRQTMSRSGRARISQAGADLLRLSLDSPELKAEIGANRALAKILCDEGPLSFTFPTLERGNVKLEMMKALWPASDEAELTQGEPFPFSLRQTTRSGKPFSPRPYQVEARRAFAGDGRPGSGFGVVVLPCGSGKTVLGMDIMRELGMCSLILTTNVAAVHQWIDELLDKTDLSPEDVGEYTGERKEIKPITVATYQILSWRPEKGADFPHLAIFRARKWGLIVYDEVHLLPAPVFKVTAEVQSTRRLGLTATLVREDGRESDVFTLVGPKRYDVPWKELEAKGFIAEASCKEIRIALGQEKLLPYAVAGKREKLKIAAVNVRKIEIARELVANHREDAILVIGQYIDQLKLLAAALGAPLITGATPNADRELLYTAFREGRERVLVVSKVANFAIDLPDASVAIQVSGSFGSRQEEAQRLGRILRPKKRNSTFYTLVSLDTVEEEFAANRQKFLAEQGYRYTIERWEGV